MLAASILSIALLFGGSHESMRVEYTEVASIEENNVYDTVTGTLKFRQFIYRDWHDRFVIRQYLMSNRVSEVKYDHDRRQFYQVAYVDGLPAEQLRQLRVSAVTYYVTHTWFDPEELDRRVLPVERRVGLWPQLSGQLRIQH